MTTNAMMKRKGRLRLALLAALALGSSSATLSGALAVLALQEQAAAHTVA